MVLTYQHPWPSAVAAMAAKSKNTFTFMMSLNERICWKVRRRRYCFGSKFYEDECWVSFNESLIVSSDVPVSGSRENNVPVGWSTVITTEVCGTKNKLSKYLAKLASPRINTYWHLHQILRIISFPGRTGAWKRQRFYFKYFKNRRYCFWTNKFVLLAAAQQ